MGFEARDRIHSLLDNYLASTDKPLTFGSLSEFLKDRDLDSFELEQFFLGSRSKGIEFMDGNQEFALRDVLGESNSSSSQPLDSAASHYYESIANHDLLSAEEEVELFRNLEQGRHWKQEIVLSTPYAVDKFQKKLEDTLEQDHSIKNLLDISRTEKMSTEREDKLFDRTRDVASTVGSIREELIDHLESYDTSDVSIGEGAITFRRKILSEFDRIEVDSELINSWAEDLRENPSLAFDAMIDEPAVGRILKFTEHHENYFRNQIVASNLRLVASQVKNFLNRGLSYMDLVQEGNLGLLEAIKGFEYEKGYKFSTYATWWIRQAMQRAIHQKKGIINIPVHRREEMAKVFNAMQVLRQELKEDPDSEQIADKLNWSVEKVDEILSVKDRPLSLDNPEEDDDRPLKDEIENTGVSEVESSLENDALDEAIEELLQNFEWRKQQLIRLRFGLDDGNERTLKEVGKLMDLSKERVRQIEKNVLGELTDRAEDSELEEFLVTDSES